MQIMTSPKHNLRPQDNRLIESFLQREAGYLNTSDTHTLGMW